MTRYTYTASPDFIKNLTFDYVETYSFQRGKDFEENRKLNQAEYDKLKSEKARTGKLIDIAEKRLLELEKLLGFTQYLLNEEGKFHHSSKRTNIFKGNDPNIARIKNILQTEIVEVPTWLCSPVYRDALVFYNGDNSIVSVLNICLSCQYMETKMFNHINGDYKTYELFKGFFIEIGHDIEII